MHFSKYHIQSQNGFPRRSAPRNDIIFPRTEELLLQSQATDWLHNPFIIITHMKQNNHHYKSYPHHSISSRRHPATIRIHTPKGNYSRNNKHKHVMLPTLLATIELLNLHFYIQLTYSTLLTIVPSVNNIKVKWPFEYIKQNNFSTKNSCNIYITFSPYTNPFSTGIRI